MHFFHLTRTEARALSVLLLVAATVCVYLAAGL